METKHWLGTEVADYCILLNHTYDNKNSDGQYDFFCVGPNETKEIIEQKSKSVFSPSLKRKKRSLHSNTLLCFINTGIHWVLLIFEKKSKVFTLYDSQMIKGNPIHSKIAMIMDKLSQTFNLGLESHENMKMQLTQHGEHKYYFVSSPTQYDGYNCGVFVLAFAHFFMFGIPITDIEQQTWDKPTLKRFRGSIIKAKKNNIGEGGSVINKNMRLTARRWELGYEVISSSSISTNQKKKKTKQKKNRKGEKKKMITKETLKKEFLKNCTEMMKLINKPFSQPSSSLSLSSSLSSSSSSSSSSLSLSSSSSSSSLSSSSSWSLSHQNPQSSSVPQCCTNKILFTGFQLNSDGQHFNGMYYNCPDQLPPRHEDEVPKTRLVIRQYNLLDDSEKIDIKNVRNVIPPQNLMEIDTYKALAHSGKSIKLAKNTKGVIIVGNDESDDLYVQIKSKTNWEYNVKIDRRHKLLFIEQENKCFFDITITNHNLVLELIEKPPIDDDWEKEYLA